MPVVISQYYFLPLQPSFLAGGMWSYEGKGDIADDNFFRLNFCSRAGFPILIQGADHKNQHFLHEDQKIKTTLDQPNNTLVHILTYFVSKKNHED